MPALRTDVRHSNPIRSIFLRVEGDPYRIKAGRIQSFEGMLSLEKSLPRYMGISAKRSKGPRISLVCCHDNCCPSKKSPQSMQNYSKKYLDDEMMTRLHQARHLLDLRMEGMQPSMRCRPDLLYQREYAP